MPRRYVLQGLTRVHDCCVFRWEELEGSSERTVDVHDDHCERCVDELRKLGHNLRAARERAS